MKGKAVLVLLLSVSPTVRLSAQCPDGTPPPCPGQRVALNPNRIAILPFRVTAADTLLGQGMAELLAPEFTGENGPLAVNMPTVLRTWRRAGGGLRTPLDPAQARRVAGEVGAGRLIDGSIVGLGGAITVTASVTELLAGNVRRVGPLSGPADSLLSLVGRLASGLLGVTGAAPMNFQMRLTDSPAAMRAYLEGLARFRVGDFRAAAPVFERAFALDTLFARAALMRSVTAMWGAGGAGWYWVAWKVRDRLSPQDRIYLTGMLGDHFPAGRSPEQVLADRRRAASLLPQSAEAQNTFGDYLFHFGSATDIADEFAAARAQLELAYRMDPQFEEVGHLLEIGLYTDDTALVRGMWTVWQRMSAGFAGQTAAVGRVVARVLRDSATAGRYAHQTVDPWWMFLASTLALLPADEIVQVFGEPPGAAKWLRTAFAVNTGRIAWLPDTSAARPGRVILAATLALAGDSTIAGEILARPTRPPPPDSANPMRAAAMELIAAIRSHAVNLREATVRFDSMARWRAANNGFDDPDVFDGLLLAVAWQALGDPGRALAAAQLDAWGLWPGAVLLAPRLRQEGRLAAIVGDTARAIRAYQRYLKLRRDADPVLIPERDSVQAALARLERRR